jgi:hypothetical protein
VAVDVTPTRPDGAGLVTHALATDLPHGWQYEAVFGLGQGATAGPLHLLAGLLALVMAAGLAVGARAPIRAHLFRCRARPGAQRTGSTSRTRSSGGASQMDPSRRPPVPGRLG